MNHHRLRNLSAVALALLWGGAASAQSHAGRSIQRVADISVQCPEGTAPRLPWRVWVTYSDGTSQWRQTRWDNSSVQREQAQADAREHAAGSTYRVSGHILGDDATTAGFPIEARVTVVGTGYATPAPTPVASTFPLEDVSLDGDNRLTHNRQLDIENLLSLDVTQQLYNYRDNYGLPTEGYTESDGWDSPTTKLKGHGTGHYLSALAMAFASAADEGQKSQLRRIITRMVNELRQCQERTFVFDKKLGRYFEARDVASTEQEMQQMQGTWEAFDRYKQDYKHYGYGYLNAIPPQHAVLIEKYAPYNNEQWVWAPYYTIHKQLAGLIDVATYIDDAEVADKALRIATDMGLWVWNRLHYRTYVSREGTQAERRAKPGNRYEMWNIYIAGEVGGMEESLARLSEMATDSTEKARLLEAATYFDHDIFFDALSKNIDDIRTRHANQHIPMIVGALRTYLSNGKPFYYNLAYNFWNLVQGRYRYSPGGVGNGEMFRQPYTQIVSMVGQGDPTLNETCCAYNMAKLTKELNCFTPDSAAFMDYYERTLYNQIVGSVNPYQYGVCYQYAVGLNATKPFGSETPQSTCCGGTGAENHVKYQEAAYFHNDQTLWVALYMPTTLHWRDKGVTVKQECDWPADHSTLRVSEGEGDFALKLRVPAWATSGFTVTLNGERVAQDARPSSYVELPFRHWKAGDAVEIHMPFSVYMDFGPDKLENQLGRDGVTPLDPSWVGTLMYGPLAMTATGVDNWEDATLDIDSYLAAVETFAPSAEGGVDGHLYRLRLAGRTFEPDYFRNEQTTHYFRLNLIADPSEQLKDLLRERLAQAEAYPRRNYTKKSYKALRQATDKAAAALAAAALTPEEAAALSSGIENAVAGLRAARHDLAALREAVDGTSGLRSADYTWDSYESLSRQVEKAQSFFLDPAVPQTSIDSLTREVTLARQSLVEAGSVNRAKLTEALQLAETRVEAQAQWNALEKKVPEYAPWAPHGFRRMQEAVASARAVAANAGKNHNQKEVDSAAAQLNAVLNGMRPGNLAEPEDLQPLFRLMRRTSQIEDTEEKQETLDYVQMVIKYVQDGSGTLDMIQKASDRLRTLTHAE